MTQPVVTRFAPSPTGYLHIGGARTALFNWLYARGRGGKFLLRIEDTDRERHNEGAVSAILDGLTWLGLDWDGEPVSQFSRQPRHAEIAESLLAKGAAYKCFLTPAEIEAAREHARETKTRFESPWRDRSPSEAPSGASYTIRFLAPRNGETVVRDVVQGEVRFPNAALDDLILLRSDGAPTYNLAVVVDDHDMGVTHVIRGDDHLNNAARQTQIYNALDWRTPEFAHVPLIHGSDGAKLSKRHGALGVEAYRELGYLPEGLANYLLRLGWSHGDEEIISGAKALEWFDIVAINKAPSRLDIGKLNSLNAHYIRALPADDFLERAMPFLSGAGYNPDESEAGRLRRAAPYLQQRCSTLAEAPAAAAFLLARRPLSLEGKTAKTLEKDGARALIAATAAALEAHADWSDAAALDEALKSFAEERGVGFGQIGPALRAALTAGLASPSLGEVLYSLGAAESLARLGDQAS